MGLAALATLAKITCIPFWVGMVPGIVAGGILAIRNHKR